jgi:hypothetical protein
MIEEFNRFNIARNVPLRLSDDTNVLRDNESVRPKATALVCKRPASWMAMFLARASRLRTQLSVRKFWYAANQLGDAEGQSSKGRRDSRLGPAGG